MQDGVEITRAGRQAGNALRCVVYTSCSGSLEFENNLESLSVFVDFCRFDSEKWLSMATVVRI